MARLVTPASNSRPAASRTLLGSLSDAAAKTTMAGQVRDCAPSPRRLIDRLGQVRVGGACGQVLFASRFLHLFGLVQALAHGIVERARECFSAFTAAPRGGAVP